MPGCHTLHEDEIRLDRGNQPVGWPEAYATLRTRLLYVELARIVAHFCPDHGRVAVEHQPWLTRRRRLLRRALVATTCTCGRMPEHVAPEGDGRTEHQRVWLEHATGRSAA